MGPEPSPDLIQPVIGFRLWDIRDDVLWSAGWGNTPWASGRMEAICKGTPEEMERLVFFEPRSRSDMPRHEAPQPDCGCGLYARHALSEVMPRRPLFGEPAAVGAVALWGNLEVHRLGIRAQFARILALTPWVIERSWTARRKFRRMASSYGVPVVAREDLEAEGFKHGIKVPKEMLPPVSHPDMPAASSSGPHQILISPQLSAHLRQAWRYSWPPTSTEGPPGA